MSTPDLSQWYHHNLDPIALRIGDFSIPWYWLVYVFGWFWCDAISRKISMTSGNEIDQKLFERARSDFFLWGWVSLIFCSRMTYVFIYNWSHYLKNPEQIFAIWNGGMSFHGGLIGVAIAAFALSRAYKISIFNLTDPIALAIPAVLFFGRLSNFANGELPGRISTVPWAVVFPSPFDGAPRHPSQIYEALAEGIFVGLILFLGRKKLLTRPGALSFGFMGLYAAARFFVEFFREPDPQLGLILGFSTGQWLCVFMMVCAIAGMAHISKSQTRN